MNKAVGEKILLYLCREFSLRSMIDDLRIEVKDEEIQSLVI